MKRIEIMGTAIISLLLAAGVPDILSGSGTEPNAAGAAVAPSATADAAAVPRGFDDTQPRVAAVAG